MIIWDTVSQLFIPVISHNIQGQQKQDYNTVLISTLELW
jgi:hypothetical protein